MAEYTEADLPVVIRHGEIVTLPGGGSVRFESNGEAKDVFLDDAFAPTVQLFPDCDHFFEDGGSKYRLVGMFEDGLRVEKA